jgi:F-type H+-transporting ATPase subunit b
MRTRNLLAAGLLGVVGVLTFGSAAHAQEGEEEGGGEAEEVVHEAEAIAEENGAEHADVECIPILVEGGSVDDCQEAPNPILPATNELIWGSISFTVLLVLLAKFAWPAMKQGLEARTERIRSDLAGAESAKDEAERVLTEYRAQLADAKAEAGRIIEEARQQADAVKRDQEARVQAEIAETRERAAADVEAAKAQALADLRGDVAELAIGAAEVIVQRSLDHDTQAQLVEQYIESVGSRTN